MKKICFVCHANECRSPMAEKILKRLLKKHNIKGVKVTSAGIGANEGVEMTLKAKRAMKNLGMVAGTHKSKQLKQIESDTLYITMTESEKQHLNKKNVVHFAEIVGGQQVQDPADRAQEFYNQTAHQVHYYCNLLVSKIKNL